MQMNVKNLGKMLCKEYKGRVSILMANELIAAAYNWKAKDEMR